MMRGRNRTNRFRKLRLTSEMQDAVQQQFQAFRKKFGRDPGADDPVFFDHDSAAPLPMPLETLRCEFVAVMTKARVPPAFIYAYCRTGLIVTDENHCLLSPTDRAAWDLAIEEYYGAHRLGSGVKGN
jgi:hypothetical protein